MTDIIMPRRRFLTGLAALIAAPAVVRAGSLMPVRLWLDSPYSGQFVVTEVWEHLATVAQIPQYYLERIDPFIIHASYGFRVGDVITMSGGRL